jgi:hypothetical protein
MIENKNINPQYQGDEIVAIVKERSEYIPRGTFEYTHNREVTLFPGCYNPALKVASVTIPKNNLRGKLVERLNFLQLLEGYEKAGRLYALFFGVGEASAEPIAQAIKQLNAGKNVDLDSLLG